MIAQVPFGRTGHLSTRALFGGAAFWQTPQADADRILDLLLEYGINHIDTAASYGDSELRIGPWMAQHRAKFFLATKTDERTYQGAKDQFHRSLERLRVDSVDMIQMHYLVDPQEWDVAMGPGGALEALIEAREQGLTRFIGVTGHDISVAAMHKRSLERFDFDSVLLPYNFVLLQNPQYAADFEALMALCRERNVAVQAIKSIAQGGWDNQPHTHTTWYKPLSEQAAIDKAVHWVLGRDNFFLNTPGDLTLLPKVLDAVSRYERRPSDEEMRAEVERTQSTALFT
ncbi:MAG: aldo/keto reductase [Chloroflexi bacterium]|uniref:aldo/keto reductase n=1 Tax=Candidatus Flexifilum breve TaxID=3140694 RepID=UPI003134B0F4|nr:aldo/keto reductase [Chloroflexota bacterium]